MKLFLLTFEVKFKQGHRRPDYQGSDDCPREDRSLCQEAFSRNDRESGDDTFALQRLDQDSCTHPRFRRRGLYYKLRKAVTDFLCGLALYLWYFLLAVHSGHMDAQKEAYKLLKEHGEQIRHNKHEAWRVNGHLITITKTKNR